MNDNTQIMPFLLFLWQKMAFRRVQPHLKQNRNTDEVGLHPISTFPGGQHYIAVILYSFLCSMRKCPRHFASLFPPCLVLPALFAFFLPFLILPHLPLLPRPPFNFFFLSPLFFFSFFFVPTKRCRDCLGRRVTEQKELQIATPGISPPSPPPPPHCSRIPL